MALVLLQDSISTNPQGAWRSDSDQLALVLFERLLRWHWAKYMRYLSTLHRKEAILLHDGTRTTLANHCPSTLQKTFLKLKETRTSNYSFESFGSATHGPRKPCAKSPPSTEIICTGPGFQRLGSRCFGFRAEFRSLW